MNKTQAPSRWSLQSSYTRVATSVSFAAALMVVFYFIVTTGPTLVDAHALLYRFFESGPRARTAIANFAIWFNLVMQLVIAVACAHYGKNLTGKERRSHNTLAVLWLLHPAVLFLATMVMALAAYGPNDLSGESSPNWALFGTMVLLGVIFAIAFFVTVCNADEYKMKNPIYALAIGKCLLLPCFALFIPSKFTLTLLLGSYLLDFLLHPVGEKIQETMEG